MNNCVVLFSMVLFMPFSHLIAGEVFPPNPNKTLAATVAAHNQAFQPLAPYVHKITYAKAEGGSGSRRQYRFKDGELQDLGTIRSFNDYDPHRSYLLQKTNTHIVGDGVFAGIAAGVADFFPQEVPLYAERAAVLASFGLSLYRRLQYSPTPYLNHKVQQRNFFGPVEFVRSSFLSTVMASITYGAVTCAKKRLTTSIDIVRQNDKGYSSSIKESVFNELVITHALGEGVVVGALARLYDHAIPHQKSMPSPVAAVAALAGLSLYRNFKLATPYADSRWKTQLRLLIDVPLYLLSAGGTYAGVSAALDRLRG